MNSNLRKRGGVLRKDRAAVLEQLCGAAETTASIITGRCDVMLSVCT